MTETNTRTDLLPLTVEIVSAHVANHTLAAADLPKLIAKVYAALAGAGQPVLAELPPGPAVSIRASIKPDYLVCLEDGKKLKLLRRHLLIRYNLTPNAYRAKWKLPADYPMVAPAYAERRRHLALGMGLGRKAVIQVGVATPGAASTKPRVLQRITSARDEGSKD